MTMIISTIVDLIALLFGGWVLSLLWGWFLVPVFHLPVLTVLQAIGVTLVVSLLTHRYSFNEFAGTSSQEGMDESTMSAILMNNFGYPTIVLSLGWLIHLF